MQIVYVNKNLNNFYSISKKCLCGVQVHVKNHIHMLPKGIQLANIQIVTLCRDRANLKQSSNWSWQLIARQFPLNDPPKQTPYMALGFRFPTFQRTHPLLSMMSATKVKPTQIAKTTSSWHNLYICTHMEPKGFNELL